MFNIIDYVKENSVEALSIVLLLSLAVSFFIIEELYSNLQDREMTIRDLQNLINTTKEIKKGRKVPENY